MASPGAWEPATPAEVHALFAELGVPWWLAGGYAIESAVGRRLREHGDIDVLLLRRDQLAAQEALAGWEWHAAEPPGTLRPWAPGELLPVGVHDIWCRPGPEAPWRVQLMLDESMGEYWVSRRDPRVLREISSIGRTGDDGVPYLAPEIQLFYKAREPRPKDETDFAAALPGLSAPQRRWLRDAIATTYGEHPWHARLAD
ncbi:nucleotidyltransferase domain-containing protein [Amycolatopsis anabasis]|uniref:nucleotidyltransferase domain-containing protein n=1 Tax=Amycolatopsis anabasis TaxID=1840409 RepID=UPI001FE45953|nr:amino acid transporter [Amycolatopsis anabasis]